MRNSTEKAKQGNYGEAIADFVEERRTVSFAELQDFLSPYMGTEGDISMHLPGYNNIIVWMGMSQTFLDAVQSAQATKRIRTTPSTSMVYLMDGYALNLPLAKSPRQYKTPHWLPVVFNPQK